MAGKQNPMKMMILLPMMFLMGKVDFENPMILNSARAAYLFCQVVSLLLAYYIKQKIVAKNDTRKIYVPGVKSPFDQSPNYEELTETTYVTHETAKADEFIKQTCIGAAISSFIHFKMGVNQVVLIQSVMTPMNLYENPLVQAYIFGKRDGRIWNERLEGESGRVEDQAAISQMAKEEQAGKVKKASSDILTPAEAIEKVLSAGTDADFDELWEAVKNQVNATTKDQWTALMVACGSAIDTTDVIRKLVGAGADVTAVDADGWTALHWSAFHGCPEAAETLLESCTSDQVAALLAAKSSERETAKDVAEKEAHPDVVDVLKKFASGSSKKVEKTSDEQQESELRQRKPVSSVEDVD